MAIPALCQAEPTQGRGKVLYPVPPRRGSCANILCETTFHQALARRFGENDKSPVRHQSAIDPRDQPGWYAKEKERQTKQVPKTRHR